MSQPETPRTRQKGVLKRARAKKEVAEEVWERRPTMGGLEQCEEDANNTFPTGESSRGRDVEDQYHSVQSESTDSSPNRRVAAESLVSNRNKAIHAERVKRRAELMAKKRGVVPSKPVARKEILRKYMPELTVKIPQMAEEISQSHRLSSTSSEASGGETTPPPTSQSAPPLPIQAAQPPSREDIEWGGETGKTRWTPIP
ncbi:unnamed protein product [Arctia plantaginis]|uniref:Uncharacterized protein n=1 Tax=Arctia plantaginis TaxID=874455 RepID=A0A8S0Z785_ARCPL|nr:unnamed protein product [Arctia plantaginis]